LVLLSILEGLPLFIGKARRWHPHAESSVAAVHAFIDARFS